MEENNKILILSCSHRKNNVSCYMALKLLRKIKSMRKEAEVEIIQLADVNLKSCCATVECAKMDNVKCIYADQDDFYKVYEEMIKSRSVVFIIPKYAPYPSKFIQLYERIVSMYWWGYVDKGRKEKFGLYRKPVALIGFASTPETTKDTFLSLQKSFCQAGFEMLSFGQELPGVFINRANENEDEILTTVAAEIGKV